MLQDIDPYSRKSWAVREATAWQHQLPDYVGDVDVSSRCPHFGILEREGSPRNMRQVEACQSEFKLADLKLLKEENPGTKSSALLP